MSRTLAIALGICLSALSGVVEAKSPPVCTIGLMTVHGLSEAARAVKREQRIDGGGDDFSVKTIILDPGHGGDNAGAIGVGALHEKYLTLDLAYALRDELEQRHPGVRVLLTRYWDRPVDLGERILWANRVGGDLFLSLHYNAATHDRAVGYETYFLAEDVLANTTEEGSRRGQPGTRSQKRARRHVDVARARSHIAARESMRVAHGGSQVLAATVQRELAERLETPNRGVKSANFAVLRGALMPAVVVESGFLTHPEEGIDVLSLEHRRRVVEALVVAIDAFEAQTRPAVETSTPVAAASPASTDAGESEQNQQAE